MEAIIAGTGMLVSKDNTTLPEAARIEITAFDANGNRLDSFTSTLKNPVYLTVVASHVERIHSISAAVTVNTTHPIKQIKTVSGTVSVYNSHTIDRIQTSSGHVDITNCKNLGNITTSAGNVRARDKSPERK